MRGGLSLIKATVGSAHVAATLDKPANCPGQAAGKGLPIHASDGELCSFLDSLGVKRRIQRPEEIRSVALLIQTDGRLSTVRDIHSLPYDKLREILGGPTEYVYFADGRALIVNEKFKLLGLPVNIGAICLLQEGLSKLREGISPLLAPELSTNSRILGAGDFGRCG
jgi:hypothetical protein